ncbi:hypothetical protein N0V93_000684 [Gnomoniopsis smithogilvyi]|uniref:Major facilitator superfamily (MFS) profile domain-containing protein n=1 Tax=Gnomoniopsis smithogilvyi TaxID=1191159 RepID=A0A9W8Z2B3_9PEZI|nr:hypothetical protein N0V93_000684 [Gnomoniopsis smithogilvyi]
MSVDEIQSEVEALASYELVRDSFGFITWEKDSNEHPRNWSTRRKLYDTTIVILLELYTTVISTTGAAVADAAGSEYGLDKVQGLLAFTLMYQIGQAIGGYLIPPFSELAGRWYPYIASAVFFSCFCIVVPSSATTVFIGRFITGVASAVPSVVIAGSVEDLFNSRERVWIVVIWNAATTIALCLGPIYAAYITEHCGWRWVYYSAGIGTGVLSLAVLGIKESRPSILLKRKIERVREETAITDLTWNNADSASDWQSFLQVVVVRPMHILCTEPLVILVAIISGVSWGIVYLFTESTIDIYQSMGFSKTQASLPFLAVAFGVVLTFIPRIHDIKKMDRRRKASEGVVPEDKIIGFSYAAPILTIGLTWFAWTVPPVVTHLHWIIPTMALVPIGFAVNEIAYTLSSFLADSYLLYSASAFSGLAFVRAIISGLMPLVAYFMYANLSSNLAGSVLAGISLLFCIAPWIFFRYSRRLREREAHSPLTV